MAESFLPDFYTTSGAHKVYNIWREGVNKYDPSSFYNWEEDNLPIYDLEDRTRLNWERGGYATSSVPGMVLVVSADADPISLECDPNLFTTVSAAIESIPDVVRAPVIVEIASYGDLGNVELQGFKCGYGGSIEIVNRNFAQAYEDKTDIKSTYQNATYRQPRKIESNQVSSFLRTNYVHMNNSQGLVCSAQHDDRINRNENFMVFSLPGVNDGDVKQNILGVTPINSTAVLGGGSTSSFERTDYDSSDIGDAHDRRGS